MSKLWLQMNFLFDIVQKIFNGDFWDVFTRHYSKFNNNIIVDMACGTGELRNHLSPKKYFGIDLNKSYINYSKKRFDKFKNTTFIKGDITKCKIPQSDVVFLISAIHHLSDKQVMKLCINLRKNKVKQFVVVDGVPHGPLSLILRMLDAGLGGGKYFRDEDEISKLLNKYFVIKKKGRFYATNSFYFYPFVEVLPQRRRQKVR